LAALDVAELGPPGLLLAPPNTNHLQPVCCGSVVAGVASWAARVKKYSLAAAKEHMRVMGARQRPP
jgi:hypothetical protein